MEVPASFGTRMFITVVARARHWALSRVTRIQCTPVYASSLGLILILSFHRCQGILSDLLPSCFPDQNFVQCLVSPMRPTCSTHLIILDLIFLNNVWWWVLIMELLLLRLPSAPVTSYILGPNFISPPFLKYNLCSCIRVEDQVSDPYKITRKITEYCH
jgi:hypothetical protein